MIDLENGWVFTGTIILASVVMFTIIFLLAKWIDKKLGFSEFQNDMMKRQFARECAMIWNEHCYYKGKSEEMVNPTMFTEECLEKVENDKKAKEFAKSLDNFKIKTK